VLKFNLLAFIKPSAKLKVSASKSATNHTLIVKQTIKCVQCQSTQCDIQEIKPNEEWYNRHIRQESRNKSPAEASKIVSIPQSASTRPRISMNPIKENEVKSL